MQKQSIVASLALASVVAMGILVAWFMAVLWATSVVEQTAQTQRAVEQLYVRIDGEPVIARFDHNQYQAQELMSLDRQTAEGTRQDLLHPHYVQSPDAKRWYYIRLAGVQDLGAPPVYWYLYHNGESDGRAYGVGYNSLNKHVVGYFSRDGFTSEPPPRERWFHIGMAGLDDRSTNVTTSEPLHMAEDRLHFLADGRLWRVDVRQRSVKSLAEVPTNATIGAVHGTLKELPKEEQARYLSGLTLRGKQQLAARLPEELLIIDPASGNISRLPLPANIQRRPSAFFALADGRYLAVAYGSNTNQEQKVVWLTSTGEVEREIDVSLASYQSVFNSPAASSWLLAIASPLPPAMIFSTLAFAYSEYEMGKVQSVGEGVVQLIRVAWPAMFVMFLAGVISAVLTYRRHRAYALPYVLPWTVFAFLFGIPGWIAYRYHRTWPAKLACPNCGEPVPRDRSQCTECATPFPPPPLKGIEVFA